LGNLEAGAIQTNAVLATDLRGDTMPAMRRFVALICWLSLTATDVTLLRQFLESSQFFQLGEALQRPGWNDSETLFYRALVESRFGQETTAIADLQKFLAVPRDP
jgi:hypothetical protein